MTEETDGTDPVELVDLTSPVAQTPVVVSQASSIVRKTIAFDLQVYLFVALMV